MTIDLSELAASPRAGVFRCQAPIPEAALERAARQGLHLVPIRLEGIRDKQAFLKAMGAALHFPDYFGHNWDAFYDCLADLAPAQDAATMLVLLDASAFAKAEPEEFAAGVAALQDAATYWEGEGKTLVVVIALETPALAPDLAQVSVPARE